MTGLNIAIDAETIYWIAVQLDDTATNTNIDYGGSGQRTCKKIGADTLSDPWGVSSDYYTSMKAIYAVYETAAVGTNTKVNISDVWKDVEQIQINIGDTWKDVIQVQINIGDVWKTVYG